MLSADETRELEALVAEYPQKQAAAVDAMRAVQRKRGWLSDDTMRDLSHFLGLTLEELDGLATFYPFLFRKPVGRHIILFCDSVSCWILGSNGVLSDLSGRLGIGAGETTPDGRFTLLPVACLGACDHAPALMIDEDLISDWRAEKMDEILGRYP